MFDKRPTNKVKVKVQLDCGFHLLKYICPHMFTQWSIYIGPL